jgi:hypothetical protein
MALSDSSWKVADLIVKGLIGTVISGLIAIYGMKAQQSQQEMAETNRRLQANIEFTSRQKDLDINVGMRMFEILMGHYFQKAETAAGPEGDREKLALLRMIALNFQDVPINLKPLFEQLDSQLADRRGREQLRGIAKEIARRQAFRLTVPSGFDSGPTPVVAGTEMSFPNLPFRIKVERVAQDRVRASLLLANRTIGPFSLTYFDMPIIDNVKIGAMRVSLLLQDSDGKTAKIRLIAFDSYLAADRFEVKEYTKALWQWTKE